MLSLAPAVGSEPVSFNSDIRPILSDACFHCHGPDEQDRRAGLRLDVEESAKDFVIVPGDPEASELVARIESDDPHLVMPPEDSHKELRAEQIALLKRWVAEGAPYEKHWAYAPPQPRRAPEVDAREWADDPIDRFVLHGMRKNGLEPNPEAEPVTLLRRLSFDLTGLPPTPEQIVAFAENPSRRAYARHVDRLLASPAFGERMAIYWLDLVRYADTVGYHGDQDHNISPYRDYVIDALNSNMPLDRFTREQLAGDLLPEPTTDQLVASGYNRLLQTSHEGGVQPQEYLAIYAADRVRNLSAVWMGATMGCAQCHDHKYDPYTIDDFYSMVAFFADVDEQKHFRVGSNSLPTKRPPEIGVLAEWQRNWLREVETELQQTDDPQRRAELESIRDRLEDARRRTMVTRPIEPRTIRVLPRGNWLDDSGPVVAPTVPEFLPPIEFEGERATRLDLANWLTDPADGVGGLTSRVFVNRFWYLLFGRGLSSSLADFGGQGQPPNHPELLDRLAVDFLESGWDVKRLIRRIVMTRAYRQSSVASDEQLARDPDNRWFARQSRYRLPAEIVRDNALAASGLLVRRVGGASVKPYQPKGYYRHLNFPKRTYDPHVDRRQYRRGVYVHWQRQFLHPMLKSLDAPSREECTAQRPRSNTPLEALVLLNDPSMVEASVALAAERLAATEPGDRARIAEMFRRSTSRSPDPEEAETLRALLEAEREHYRENAAQAERLVESFTAAVPDRLSSDPAELAAWTSVARAILNLYECVARY